MAEIACNQLGWNLIKDGNSNTFMDIGTGARYDNRPALQRAINNTSIDTIIGCAFDRIGRSADVWEYIENDANLHNKNIMYVEYTERYNAIEDLVSNIIRTITGDYNL
jgi:DNA invertase Pin-like site-specific DNA recombinase